jgi:Domain of unknown function (DUF4266)
MSGAANKEMKMKQRLILALVCTGAALALGGCASTEGLGNVNAWEKGNLAKKDMTFEGDSLDSRFVQHIYGSKENATGGYGVGGGGCGCN